MSIRSSRILSEVAIFVGLGLFLFTPCVSAMATFEAVCLPVDRMNPYTGQVTVWATCGPISTLLAGLNSMSLLPGAGVVLLAVTTLSARLLLAAALRRYRGRRG